VFDSATFDAICSDLTSYPIASAVAASAAVPVVFAPVVLQTFPNQCATELPGWIERAQGNPAASPILKEFANAVTRYRNGDTPYIKLLDGGLVDNYGLSGFTIARLSAGSPYGPLTPQQAVRIRRFLFLVIDGGRGPSGDWGHTLEGPTGQDLLMAAADTAIDSSVRSSFTAFDRTMSEWRDALVRWRCGLSAAERRRYGLNEGWSCNDLKFFVGRINFDGLGNERASELNAVPTRFKLPAETVDMVIEAGHQALHANPTFKGFLSSL
jgi:NTE family protein